jgi:hypothetical protein
MNRREFITLLGGGRRWRPATATAATMVASLSAAAFLRGIQVLEDHLGQSFACTPDFSGKLGTALY